MKNLVLIFLLLNFLSVHAQADRKVPNDSIPASAKVNMAEKFKGYKISTAQLGTENGEQVYKVEMRKEVSTDKTLIYNLIYNKDGKLLSKKKDKEVYYSTAPEKDPGNEKKDPFPRQ